MADQEQTWTVMGPVWAVGNLRQPTLAITSTFHLCDVTRSRSFLLLDDLELDPLSLT